ncbi:MAG TPA: hypothetical protein GXX69_00010 [Firmicutes bacterium]|nr:hypothetical protein [Bacillota bacterium]
MAETVRQMPKRYFVVAAILTILFFVSMGTAMAIRGLLVSDKIVPGVSISGIDVGGQDATAAKAMLLQKAKAINETSLSLELVDEIEQVSAQEVGIEADIEETIKMALALGRRGRLWDQLRERYQIKKEGYFLDLEICIDEQRLTGFLTQLAQQVDEPAQDGYFTLGSRNEMVPVPEKIGRSLEVDEAKQLIISAVEAGGGPVKLPIRQVIPCTLAELRQRGINDVIAVYNTRFNPGDKDRNHNLRLGAQALNGRLIDPGEVVSFNNVVGPREAEQGYKEAPIIIEDELVPGVGGGICQVSSTLYNAVLLSGLTPVERLNHSLPIGYLPLGRDATVSYGTIDFKFKNTRPESVMIATRVTSDRLVIAILGTARGEQVEIQSIVEEEIPFPVTYKEDPTLPPGTDTLKQEGKPGYKVTVTRIIRRNGSVVRQEVVSRDTYQPRPEIHLVGPLLEETEGQEQELELLPVSEEEPELDEGSVPLL